MSEEKQIDWAALFDFHPLEGYEAKLAEVGRELPLVVLAADVYDAAESVGARITPARFRTNFKARGYRKVAAPNGSAEWRLNGMRTRGVYVHESVEPTAVTTLVHRAMRGEAV